MLSSDLRNVMFGKLFFSVSASSLEDALSTTMISYEMSWVYFRMLATQSITKSAEFQLTIIIERSIALAGLLIVSGLWKERSLCYALSVVSVWSLPVISAFGGAAAMGATANSSSRSRPPSE